MGESAWTLDPIRDEYYYHRFSKSQPDLNLRNEDVKQEMNDALQFWMGHGVDGFRVIGAPYLFEDADRTDVNILHCTKCFTTNTEYSVYNLTTVSQFSYFDITVYICT